MKPRERWLVIQGYLAGFGAAGGIPPADRRISELAEAWLDDCCADGVTVEMALEKEVDEQDKKWGCCLTPAPADLLRCPQCQGELHNGYCQNCKAAFEIASR